MKTDKKTKTKVDVEKFDTEEDALEREERELIEREERRLEDAMDRKERELLEREERRLEDAMDRKLGLKAETGDKDFADLPPEVARRFEDAMTIDRLRAHVAHFVAEAKGAGDGGRWLPVEEIERVEGRSAIDLVVDYLARDRGLLVENPTPTQELHRIADEQYRDGAKTRHEKEIVREAVYHLFANFTTYTGEELRRIVRKFYRRGDEGITKALLRAVLSAIA